jgi:uncharacterized membrane protein YeaQ/YmgE (transglycosylase-associated protein family)
VSSKTIVYLFVFIGSIVGAYIPSLWGAGYLSISSLVFSSIGAIIGIIISLKLTS